MKKADTLSNALLASPATRPPRAADADDAGMGGFGRPRGAEGAAQAQDDVLLTPPCES